MRYGNGSIVCRADGTVAGRIYPCKKIPGAKMFIFTDSDKKVHVRRWGPAELALKVEHNSWSFKESYFTAKVVGIKDNKVVVLFTHSCVPEWNICLSADFKDGWQKDLCQQLYDRSILFGTETHVANYDEMVV